MVSAGTFPPPWVLSLNKCVETTIKWQLLIEQIPKIKSSLVHSQQLIVSPLDVSSPYIFAIFTSSLLMTVSICSEK